MPVFLELIKRIAPYFKYIVFGATVVILTVLLINKNSQLTELDKAMELYKRQVAGQLTEKERQFQEANNALGVAQSKLMEQKELLKAYQKENIKINAEFEKFKKEHKAELESYQRTIAKLEQQIKDGSTVVSHDEPRLPTDPLPDKQFDRPIDPQKSKLAYNWKSKDGRFEFNDPDVFSSNNETFKLRQNFRITGEIYREKAGFLKTHRLIVEEVLPDGKNDDGTTKYKTVASAQVVESKFNYSERAPDSWVPRKGVFGIWGTVSANFALNNGLNPRFLLGTGFDFIQYKGLGLGIQVYIDVNEWKDSGFGIDLTYRPIVKGTQLNIGIDLGLATQFRQPFQSYIPMVGLKFFLW